VEAENDIRMMKVIEEALIGYFDGTNRDGSNAE
jgi:hypothetical protein